MALFNPNSILFVLTVVAVYAWVCGISWVSLGRRALVPIGLLTGWLVLQAVLAHHGFYDNNMTVPPRIMLAIGPPVATVLLLSILWPSRKVIIALPIFPLLLLHSCRLPVEIVLLGLYKAGLVPQ